PVRHADAGRGRRRTTGHAGGTRRVGGRRPAAGTGRVGQRRGVAGCRVRARLHAHSLSLVSISRFTASRVRRRFRLLAARTDIGGGMRIASTAAARLIIPPIGSARPAARESIAATLTGMSTGGEYGDGGGSAPGGLLELGVPVGGVLPPLGGPP